MLLQRNRHNPCNLHTSAIDIDSPLGVLLIVLEIVPADIAPSRSGYDAAENRQKGADSPIFSLLKAIYVQINHVTVIT